MYLNIAWSIESFKSPIKIIFIKDYVKTLLKIISLGKLVFNFNKREWELIMNKIRINIYVKFKLLNNF